MLGVARWTTVVAGAMSVALAIVVPSVGDVLIIFYTLLAVSLFVPIIAGLWIPRVRAAEALAAIGVGVPLVVVTRFGFGGNVLGLTPAMWGLLGAVCAAALVALARSVVGRPPSPLRPPSAAPADLERNRTKRRKGVGRRER